MPLVECLAVSYLQSSLKALSSSCFRIRRMLNIGFKGEYPLWHIQRKTISKIFFRNNFENFLQTVFIRHSRVLCDVLDQHAQNGTPVDAQNLMFSFTLDGIAEIGFGVTFDSLKNPMPLGKQFDRAQVR